eukprot:16442022-Heterocapsa_arctica.AAC.1
MAGFTISERIPLNSSNSLQSSMPRKPSGKKNAKGRRELGGLTGTVDWTIPRKLTQKLEKGSPGQAGTLRNILAGG